MSIISKWHTLRSTLYIIRPYGHTFCIWKFYRLFIYFFKFSASQHFLKYRTFIFNYFEELTNTIGQCSILRNHIFSQNFFQFLRSVWVNQNSDSRVLIFNFRFYRVVHPKIPMKKLGWCKFRMHHWPPNYLYVKTVLWIIGKLTTRLRWSKIGWKNLKEGEKLKKWITKK